MIPIAQPAIGEEEISAVREVMLSGMLAQGAVTSEFEEKFAGYCGAEYGVAANSGTAALHAALKACGIGHHDEVIVPSFTFIATATAVSMCGAKPVMVDINEDTFTINPEEVEKAITPATKAVIGVHLFGQPFDLGAVGEICEEHGLQMIEDCAQAHGATWRGRRVGTFGAAGCFSFYPTKNMTTGEGGMVVTGDAKTEERLRRFVNHGQSEKYLHTSLGYNYRMSNMNAAIGLVQLDKLDSMNKQRQENAAYFNSHLSVPGIVTPVTAEGAGHVYHQYVLKINDAFPMTRDEFMAFLREKGIGSAIHYPLGVHQQPLYMEREWVKPCPVSEACTKSVLSLPVHPRIGPDECRYICETINGVE